MNSATLTPQREVEIEDERASQFVPQQRVVADKTSVTLTRNVLARILVVDDEPDVQLSVRKRLVSAGYEVITAGDGFEATKMAIQCRPDLIVLDIGMPCGDGHVVAERLRDNVSTSKIPVIYLTARTSPVDRDKALALGAFAFVTKPFKSEEILELIQQALR